MSNWRDDEIRELLSIRADAEIVRQIHGTARDSVVYVKITNLLRERGVIRAKAQVNNKLKTLKRQYHQVVDPNGQSGNDRETWPYFSLCEAIWGSSHSTNPVALVGSTKTASTSRTPEILFSSSGPETPHSDTEEQTPVHEIDVSINDSILSTGSSCLSPLKKKRRRNQTRTERQYAEMRDLFSEMDKDFNERERLRLLEQREYEERVRREARVERVEDKAQEMTVLQDMTSLLRQMVQQRPQSFEQREYEERVRREARVRAQETAVLQDMTDSLRQMVQQMSARQPQNPHSAHTSWSQDPCSPRDQKQGPSYTDV